jgi:hypothetical protein
MARSSITPAADEDWKVRSPPLIMPLKMKPAPFASITASLTTIWLLSSAQAQPALNKAVPGRRSI